MLDPQGCVRLAWDCVARFLVMTACILAPVMLCFYESPRSCHYIGLIRVQGVDTGGNQVPLGLQCTWSIIHAFFLADILLNFFTGYVTPEGYVEYSASAVSRHYVCTWVPLDAAACLPLVCFLPSWKYAGLLIP